MEEHEIGNRCRFYLGHIKNMEVSLYNSSICRLCSEDNENGSLLYVDVDENQKLCDIINTYLPIKVSDDGILPRTICPGCTIQLEATTDFLNLIINGQKILRELFEREKELKKSLEVTVEEVITDNVVYDINFTDGVYQADHPIALQVAGVDKPKRKRGRPPKKLKTPEELAREEAIRNREKQELAQKETHNEDLNGKRKRKAPTRLQETVQGQELERILKEEGVIDEEESEPEPLREPLPVSAMPEIIGHLVTSDEPVAVKRGKGRGRPRGRSHRLLMECTICGMLFSCKGRYMSHVAAHGQANNLNKVKLNEDVEETGLPNIDDKQDQSESSVPTKSDVTQETSNEINVDVLNGVAENIGNVNIIEIKDVDKTDEGTTIDNTAEVDSGATAEVETGEAKDEKSKHKCSLCPKTFSSRQAKSMHVKAAHLGERRYWCAECGARFAYPRSLKLHAATHRKMRAAGFGCDVCGKVLNHPSSITYHKEAAHAGHRYVCDKCDKPFKHRQLLQRHQLVHSPARPFSCPVCDARFKTKTNLTNHQMLHSGVKRFACEICKHRFAHKTSLTLHLRWHAGLKPYTCGMCGKAFSQKGNLLEHQRIHTGEKPFACPACPRRFTTSSQHALHVRRHGARCADWPRASKRRRRPRPASPVALQEPVAAPDGVVYVAYDVDDPDAMRMLQAEEVGSVMGEHVPVTDEHGNPLHFTMQDGTRLAITSSDGNTLQVITQDGQTIPVEINGYTEEEEVDNPDTIVHQLDLQKTADVGNTSPVTQYFTQ